MRGVAWLRVEWPGPVRLLCIHLHTCVRDLCTPARFSILWRFFRTLLVRWRGRLLHTRVVSSARTALGVRNRTLRGQGVLSWAQ